MTAVYLPQDIKRLDGQRSRNQKFSLAPLQGARSNLEVLNKYPEGISNLSHIVLQTPNGMAHLPLGRARCNVSRGVNHFIPPQIEFGLLLKRPCGRTDRCSQCNDPVFPGGTVYPSPGSCIDNKWFITNFKGSQLTRMY